MTPAEVYADFQAQCRTEADKDALDWAKQPTLDMVLSEDGIEERVASGQSVRDYMLDDLKYRLGEQMLEMAEDQQGLPSYPSDMKKAKAAQRLAERLR